jgi:hypothetical protein
MEGHCIQLELTCDVCGVTQWWKGSAEYPDGSMMVNRDVTRAFFTCGGQPGFYQRVSNTLRCGVYNADSYDNTIALIIPFILEMEDETYAKNIEAVNYDPAGCILGFDCQHCRSQRIFGPAKIATTTFINHTPGPNYGKILYQNTINSQEMKELQLKPNEKKKD